jgi:TatD DNase family protein
MIDTHTHIYVSEFSSDVETLIAAANAEGVSKFYMPAIDATHVNDMLKMQTNYREQCRLMAGLHPCSVTADNTKEFDVIHDVLLKHKVYGIGETGLDFYWDKTFVKEQEECLEMHIQLALKHNLPLILHTRNAMQETIETIKKYKHSSLRGIFHCFSGSYEQAKEIIKTGFYLGIGGVITYKNAGLPEVLSKVDLQHLVLETDAPYLTPVPFRGKRNEPSYLKYIAAKLAEVKLVTVAEVDEITTKNAINIFGN